MGRPLGSPIGLAKLSRGFVAFVLVFYHLSLLIKLRYSDLIINSPVSCEIQCECDDPHVPLSKTIRAVAFCKI